jgi:ABC-type lipoprotein export system ATPase subunit
MTTLPNARPINPKEFMPATSERAHPSEISIGRKKAVTPLTSVPMMTASIVAAEPTASQDIDTSNDVPLDAINHSRPVRGIVLKY